MRPADDATGMRWEPVTAVQVIAHRVARRRVFLVCAGIWAVTALVLALTSVWVGATAAGVVLAAVTCLIGGVMSACVLMWRRRPVPSPDHLYPMTLPHTPASGWAWFAVVSVAWVGVCVASGALGQSVVLDVVVLAVVPALIGSPLLVPGLLMGTRRRQLADLLAKSSLAQRELESLASDWRDPDGRRPFGRV